MKPWLCLVLMGFIANSTAQNLYLPPSNSVVWDTLSPGRLGWCQDRINSLYDYLQSQSTKSFIMLKDGKIVLEKYFGSFTKDSLWIWYSAGKSLHAVLMGIAQEQGYLTITDKTSKYLGAGWTSLAPAKEDLISIRHQLTMTTGLNELAFFCVEPKCLLYKADAGTRWAYHNGPYDLLKEVMETATSQNINLFTTIQLKNKIGMQSGIWISVPPNHFFLSTARDMARFGLLMQNKMNWNGMTILRDTTYYHAMISPSQTLNPSYGYLWWLNGQPQYITPTDPNLREGPIAPHAPSDVFAAGGSMGQFVSVSPKTGLIMIRQGLSTEDDLSGLEMHEKIWEKIMGLSCLTVNQSASSSNRINIYPNPVTHHLNIDLSDHLFGQAKIMDLTGRLVKTSFVKKLNLDHLASGVYILSVFDRSMNLMTSQKFILR